MDEVGIAELKHRLMKIAEGGLDPRQFIRSAHESGEISTTMRCDLMVWWENREVVV